MPNDFAIFGPIVTTNTVEKAIIALAEEWLPTYVNVVAESMGLPNGSIKYPVAFQHSYDFDNYLEGNTPIFIVVSEGTIGEFERGEAGEIGAWFSFQAAVLVADQTEPSTRTIASLYASAIALMLEQRARLGTLADQTLTRKIETRLPVKGNRSLALGQVNGETFVNSIMNRDAGPPTGTIPPAIGPYTPATTPYGEFSKANTITTEVDAEQLEENF